MFKWLSDQTRIKGTISDFDDPFRRRVIAETSIGLGLVIIVASLIRQMIANGNPTVVVWNIFLALIILTIPVLLKRAVSIRKCGLLLVACISLLGLSSGLVNGGMRAPAVVVFVMGPMIGFFTAGSRGARLALFLSILGITLLQVAEHFSLSGPVVHPEKYTEYKSAIYIFATLATYTIGAAYEHSRRISEKILSDLSIKALQASKMSTLGEMAAGIAHEINNPLAIIVGNASMIIQQLDSDQPDLSKIKEQVLKINNTSTRIAKIVKGLRTFSRNSDVEPYAPTPIAQIIQDTLDLCSERFKAQAIELRINYNKDLIIQCRPIQISQVILNLLINAFDAVQDLKEKWVALDVVDSGNSVRVSVTDSGPGIAPAIAEKIMDPFFTTKEVGKGTGLGLSISLGIAQAHQGNLRYDPQSKNTRFVLELPKTQSDSQS